jgi:hypothetical protein
MRLFSFLLFVSPVLLSAQIEIDPFVPAVGEVPPDAGEVTAPESTDHSASPEQVEDTVRFLNGNELTGTLLQVDEERLVWEHPDVEAPIRFATRNLKAIKLRTDGTSPKALLQLPQIELTNGDVYRGEITGLQNGRLSLQSPATGPVTLQADLVNRIVPNPLDTSLYDGPGSDEEWTYNNLGGGNEQWFYQDRALYATGQNLVAVYRPESLPNRVTLSMDLEWKGMLNFQLGYWGDNTQNPNQNASVISLQNNYLRAYRNYNNIGRNNFLNQQIQHDLQDGMARLVIHLDREKKQTVFLIDGKMIGQWRDMFDGKVPGDDVLLYTQGNAVIRVSGIRIREWDGELRTGQDEPGEGHDWLMTTTGDEFVGEVIHLVEGVLTFKNEFAEFQVPLERVGEIRFNPETRKEPAPAEAGQVKVISLADEVLTLKLERMDQGVLTGSSEAAGPLSLDLRYYSELILNPEDPRHQEDEWSW